MRAGNPLDPELSVRAGNPSNPESSVSVQLCIGFLLNPNSRCAAVRAGRGTKFAAPRCSCAFLPRIGFPLNPIPSSPDSLSTRFPLNPDWIPAQPQLSVSVQLCALVTEPDSPHLGAAVRFGLKDSLILGAAVRENGMSSKPGLDSLSTRTLGAAVRFRLRGNPILGAAVCEN